MSDPTTERSLSVDFWLGKVDPRPLALFRIGFGLILLYDLYDYTRDFSAFLTDDGMLPRGAATDPWAWSLFHLVGSPLGAGVLFAIGAAGVVAFTLGFFTRAVTVGLWVFFASLHNRNLYVLDGGDDLARILLFWSMFADLGACYSLDVSRGRRPAGRVPAFPLRILQLHIALLYFNAGWSKVRAGWLHGTGLYLAMQHVGFLRPVGFWLSSHTALCSVLSRSVVFCELGFAPLAFLPFFTRPSRALAIASSVAVQIGVFVTMRVGIFTELMIWVSVLFAQADWLDRAEAWWRGRRGLPATLSSAARPDVGEPWRAPPAQVALFAAMGMTLSIAWWDSFLGTHIPLPEGVKSQRRLAGLVQPADLFGRRYDVAVWHAEGKLADGTPVDVLPVAAPSILPSVGLRYSRWYKFTFKYVEPPFRFQTLGPWLCRSFDEHSGKHLKSLVLSRDVSKPHVAGEAPYPVRVERMLSQDCDEATAGGS